MRKRGDGCLPHTNTHTSVHKTLIVKGQSGQTEKTSRQTEIVSRETGEKRTLPRIGIEFLAVLLCGSRLHTLLHKHELGNVKTKLVYDAL